MYKKIFFLIILFLLISFMFLFKQSTMPTYKQNNFKSYSVKNYQNKNYQQLGSIPKKKTHKKSKNLVKITNLTKHSQIDYQIKETLYSRYLTYQKKLDFIREGGVKSKLLRIKENRESRFKKLAMREKNIHISEHYKRLQHSQAVHYQTKMLKYMQKKQYLEGKYKGEQNENKISY